MEHIGRTQMEQIECINNNKEHRGVFLWCLLAFAVSAAASLTVSAVNGIFPFGEKSILFSDLSSEYMPFLTELYDKIHSGESLFYSWRTAAGGSFLGNIFYYLSSPFNLAALLFGRSQIQNVMAFLILLRQALSASAMTAFLSLRKNGKPGVEAVVCGFLYAFCGWFVAYYYSVIWLDVFMLLPLLLLGIERIIDSGSAKLYIPVFAVMLFSNFYLAYFVCIFAVIYWLYYFFISYSFKETEGTGKNITRKKFTRSRFFRTGLVFDLSSVFCVLLMSFVTVPFIMQMSGNTANSQTESLAPAFSNIAQQTAALFSGMTSNSNRYDSYANIYSGVLALVCLPLFFCTKGISVKEKLISAGVLLFFFLSFNLKPLDFIWHGFRWPNSYPFRESFFFSCFLLIITHRLLLKAAQLTKKAAALCACVLPILLITAAAYITKRNYVPVITGADIGLTALFFTVFAALIFIPKKKKAIAVICSALLLTVSFADVVYTFKDNILTIPDGYSSFETNYTAVKELTGTDSVQPYRTEITRKWLANDGAYFGYNGLRQSSSSADSAFYGLLKKLGMDTNISNYAGYFPQTPAFNSIFGVKHLLERQDWDEAHVATLSDCAAEGYTPAGENGVYRMFDYSFALPLGFAASEDLADWKPEEHKVIENQNGFFSLSCGESGILNESDSDAEIIFTSENVNVSDREAHRYTYACGAPEVNGDPSLAIEFKADKDGMFYIYFDKLSNKDDKYTNIKVIKPDDTAESFSVITSTLTSAVYNAKKGDVIDVYIYLLPYSSGELTVRGFQTDGEKMKSAYNKICSYGTLQTDEFSDGYLAGKITVEGENKILCTSVPYDRGWSITVDGQELPSDEILKIGGALMGFKLTPGEHTVTFSFFPAGLRAGAAVTSAALAGGIIFLLIYKKRKSGEAKHGQTLDNPEIAQ